MNDPLDRFEVFPWNPNFNTGIEAIDLQHQQLVSLLNKLAGTLVQGELPQIAQVFDSLADYARFHFEQEEAIWAKNFGDDNWLHSHQLRHAAFLPEVLKLRERRNSPELCALVEDLVKFLIRWLAFHILDEDKRMSLVLEARERGLSLMQAKLDAEEKMSGSIRLLIDTVLTMYDDLSSRTLELMREREQRRRVEAQLRESNRQLALLATTDPLTEVHNRRHFEQIFAQELKRALRNQSPLTLILIDLDYFKTLNDQFGHQAGDQALTRVGTCLKELCRRPSDFCFRIGGEEFAVLAANLPLEGALTLAERLRGAVEELAIPFSADLSAGPLTLSAGVVSEVPNTDCDMDHYLNLADRRLYRAKDAGRNRVICSD